LKQLFELADTFLCISTYTEYQLRTCYEAYHSFQPTESKKFATFFLGAELDVVDAKKKVRTKIRSVFQADKPVYLAVGTLEPRKNHAYLLEVFQSLWNEGSFATLLIIGRVGWMSEELLETIRHHPKIGQQLFFMDDIDDAELDYCYTHARALLAPAIVEGFGLPIIEALSKGLPVFASDIPVFHEVAGMHATYFDYTTVASLAGLLRAYDASDICPACFSERFVWPDWSQSTIDLLSRLVALKSSTGSVLDVCHGERSFSSI
jgi:alpha-1,2-rhamnosyltransferase